MKGPKTPSPLERGEGRGEGPHYRLLFLLPLIPIAAFIAAPLPPHLLDYRPVTSVKILDRDHNLLRELRSTADGRSTPLTASEIPLQVQAAFLAAEDHRFPTHVGVSPISILRALKQNLRAGHVVAGGSTITQQLSRALIPRERTILGKAASHSEYVSRCISVDHHI